MRKGFTLAEILISVGIIGALAAITIQAIDIRGSLVKSYDTERRAGVDALNKSLNNYHWDTGYMVVEGSMCDGEANATPICTEGTSSNDCTDNGGLLLDVLAPDYITAIPQDTAEPCQYYSGYKVYREAGRALVVASHMGTHPSDVTGSCDGNGGCTQSPESGPGPAPSPGPAPAPAPAPGPGSPLSCASPNGEVHAIAYDSSNQVTYFGGAFTQVGATTRNRLAAVDSDCTLLSWNPNADGTVYTITTHGGDLYIGGAFQTIGGQTRNHLAKVDTSGNLLSWNPNADGEVYTILIRSEGNDTMVYVGGAFNMIGSPQQSRNYLSKLNPSANVTGWQADTDAPVRTLVEYNNTLYVGGEFNEIDGEEINYLAAVSITSGNVDSGWTPEPDNTVRALKVDGGGDLLYVGGDFQSMDMGMTPRNFLAVVDLDTNMVGSWDPDADSSVFALEYSSGTVYAGGSFSSLGGSSRNNVAAISTEGVVTSWDPDAEDRVNALVLQGSNIALGGKFDNLAGNTAKAKFFVIPQ